MRRVIRTYLRVLVASPGLAVYREFLHHTCPCNEFRPRAEGHSVGCLLEHRRKSKSDVF